MISLLNDQFVPVWINVRTTPLPRLAVLKQVLLNATVDGDNKISDTFSKGFFLRSVVLTPDGREILNPQPRTVGKSIVHFAMDGDLGYAEVDGADFLTTLRHSLERFQSETAAAGRKDPPYGGM
ncbi:MAG: hypothetical protein ACHQ17_03480 [Polyangia bacterium]